MRAGFYAGPLTAQPFLEIMNKRGGPDAALATIAVAALAAALLFVLVRRRFDPVPEEPAPSL